jgi:phosphatidate cytidylyltransferase
MVTVVVLLGLSEFYRMSLPAERKAERYAAVAVGGLLTLVPVLNVGAALPSLTLVTFFFAIWFLLRFGDLHSVIQHLALVLLGFLYLPLLLGHLSLLHGLPHGKEWIFLVLFIVMLGDSAAYFTGINWGRRKLYPAVSPNKSVEGALGGLLGSFVGALLFKYGFFPELSVGDCVILGLGLGALGQVGDLFESMLKRSFGVKDSGTLIPGHGGILDRLDSLIFAFAPAYYYALWFFQPLGLH